MRLEWKFVLETRTLSNYSCHSFKIKERRLRQGTNNILFFTVSFDG
jgi:hypothetical protein